MTLRVVLSTVAAATLVLAACNNIAQQRSLAEQGVFRLRDAWNRGDCGTIYDDGDGYFRRNQARDTWLRKCADLRHQLGPWREFRITDGAVWPVGTVGIVWVSGPAAFAQGEHTVRADFQLDSSGPKLFALVFDIDGKTVQIPGYSGRLVD